MLIKDFDTALKAAGSATAGAVFSVAGEEPFQAMTLEKALRGRAGALGLETVRLSGEEILPGVFHRLASEGSLFGSGRFFIVRNADAVPARSQGEVLEAPGQTGSPHIFLFLTLRQSLNTSFLKKLGAFGTVFQCWEPFPGRMWNWTGRLADRADLRLDRRASDTASALSFGRLINLAGIIERLSIRYGPGASVTSEMVLSISGAPPECSALEMAGHAVSCRRAQALSMLSILLSAGEEPIRLLALIHSQWVLAVSAAGLLNRGEDESRVAAALGISPYRARSVLEAARPWRRRALAPVAGSFAETDMKLKYGWDSHAALVPFIIALTLPGE